MSEPLELPDLPALERWGEVLRDATERVEQRSARRRFPLHRSVLAAAVMLVLVPGAIATRSIWVDPVDAPDPLRTLDRTPPVLLAQGRSGAVTWRLGAFLRRNGVRCVQLETYAPEQAISGSCSAPLAGAAELLIATDAGGGRGFVYGITGPRVAEVSVTAAGGPTVDVATQEPDPESLRRSGLPPLRSYVAVFPGHVDLTHPPLVVARDAGGHVLGTMGSGAP